MFSDSENDHNRAIYNVCVLQTLVARSVGATLYSADSYCPSPSPFSTAHLLTFEPYTVTYPLGQPLPLFKPLPTFRRHSHYARAAPTSSSSTPVVPASPTDFVSPHEHFQFPHYATRCTSVLFPCYILKSAEDTDDVIQPERCASSLHKHPRQPSYPIGRSEFLRFTSICH